MTLNASDELAAIEIEEQYKADEFFTKEKLRQVIELAQKASLGNDYWAKVDMHVLCDEIEKMDKNDQEATMAWSPFVDLVGEQDSLPEGKYRLVHAVDYGGAIKRCQNGANSAGNPCNHEIRYVFEVEHQATKIHYEIGSVCIHKILGDHPIIQVALSLLDKIKMKVNKDVKIDKLRAELGDLLDRLFRIDPNGWFVHQERQWRTWIRNGTNLGDMSFYRTKDKFKLTMLAIQEKWADESKFDLLQEKVDECRKTTKYDPYETSYYKAGFKPTRDMVVKKGSFSQTQPNVTEKEEKEEELTLEDEEVALGLIADFAIPGTLDHIVVKVAKIVKPTMNNRKSRIYLEVEDSEGEMGVVELFRDQMEIDTTEGDLVIIKGGWIKQKSYNQNGTYSQFPFLSSGKPYYGGTLEIVSPENYEADVVKEEAEKEEEAEEQEELTLEPEEEKEEEAEEDDLPQPEDFEAEKEEEVPEVKPETDKPVQKKKREFLDVETVDSGIQIKVGPTTIQLSDLESLDLVQKLNKAFNDRLNALEKAGITELS